MNKFLAVACFAVLASPAFAQGMAGPSHMGNDTMKMDHKKPVKKPAMKHDGMGAGMAAPSGGMASGSMTGPGH